MNRSLSDLIDVSCSMPAVTIVGRFCFLDDAAILRRRYLQWMQFSSAVQLSTLHLMSICLPSGSDFVFIYLTAACLFFSHKDQAPPKIKLRYWLLMTKYWLLVFDSNLVFRKSEDLIQPCIVFSIVLVRRDIWGNRFGI